MTFPKSLDKFQRNVMRLAGVYPEPVPPRFHVYPWTVRGSMHRAVVRQERMLNIIVAPLADGSENWAAAAVEASSNANSLGDLFGRHAHAIIAERESLAECMRLADLYIDKWITEPPPPPCDCDEIATPPRDAAPPAESSTPVRPSRPKARTRSASGARARTKPRAPR